MGDEKTDGQAEGARRRRRPSAGWLFIAPWLVGFAVFTAGPMVASFVLSFTDYDLQTARYVGGANYHDLVTRPNPNGGYGDPRFWQSLWNTLFYTAFAVPLGLTGSLLLALLLNQRLRGLALFRTAFYLPSLVPAVASSLLWIWILQPDRGLMNQALAAIGITGPRWLNSEAWSKPSLILMSLWAVGGSRMIIFLAGLQGISDSYYEAARIDGAGPIARFRHVTLPLITPVLFFNLILGVIGAFQTFTTAFITTGGGPNDSTLFYAYYIYNSAFSDLKMGKASALAWLLFLILLVFTFVQFRNSRKWVHYEGAGSDE